MRYRFILIIIQLAFATGVFAQSTTSFYRLSFTDSSRGVTLAGVYVKVGSNGAISDANGTASFSLQAGKNYTVVAHLLGYRDTTFAITARHGTQRMEVKLRERSEVLREAQVVAQPLNTARDVMDREVMQTSVRYKELRSTPMIGGERDIVKGLMKNPGVQTGLPGGADLFVRGSDVYHNAMLLEGVPILNNNHGFGYLSPFAPAGVQSMQFHKQGFSPQYGNNLSSLMDVKLRRATADRFTGQIAVGPASFAGGIGIPLKPDTSGIFISGRVYSMDLFEKAASLYVENASTISFFNFQDFSVQAYHHFNEATTLEAFGYWSGDQTDFENEIDAQTLYQFNNQTSAYAAGLRLRHQKRRVEQSHQLYLSGYQLTAGRELLEPSSRLGMDADKLFENNNRLLQMGYQNYWKGGGANLTWKVGSDWRLYHQRLPQINGVLRNEEIVAIDRGSNTEWAPALFAEATYNWDTLLTLQGGLRAEYYQPSSRSDIVLLPHLSLRRTISQRWAVFAAYDRTANVIHRYRNTSFTNPMDIPALATEGLPYTTVDQFTLGAVHVRKHWRAHASLFYRDMQHVIDRDYSRPVVLYAAQTQVPTADITEGLLSVNGESYGLELHGSFEKGIWSGSLSYTWSESTRQADFLNRGRAYPFEFNRRHFISSRLKVRFKKNEINKITELGVGYTYGTGNYSQFALQNQINHLWDRNGPTSLVAERNNVQLPPLSHLDITLNFMHERDNGNLRVFSISVFNVLINTMITQFEDKVFENGKLTAIQGNGPFAIIPSINYELHFK